MAGTEFPDDPFSSDIMQWGREAEKHVRDELAQEQWDAQTGESSLLFQAHLYLDAFSNKTEGQLQHGIQGPEERDRLLYNFAKNLMIFYGIDFYEADSDIQTRPIAGGKAMTLLYSSKYGRLRCSVREAGGGEIISANIPFGVPLGEDQPEDELMSARYRSKDGINYEILPLHEDRQNDMLEYFQLLQCLYLDGTPPNFITSSPQIETA